MATEPTPQPRWMWGAYDERGRLWTVAKTRPHCIDASWMCAPVGVGDTRDACWKWLRNSGWQVRRVLVTPGGMIV